MQSFEEWAGSTPNRRCKTCALPDDVYAQVVAAREQGYGSINISRWLAANGHSVTYSSIDNHFVKGNHDR